MRAQCVINIFVFYPSLFNICLSMYNVYAIYVYKIYLYKIYVYKLYVYKLYVYNLNVYCPRSVIFCSALFLKWSTRSLYRDLVNAYYAGMLQVNKEEEIQKMSTNRNTILYVRRNAKKAYMRTILRIYNTLCAFNYNQ